MSRDLCIMACIFCREIDFQDWVRIQAEERHILFVGGRLPARNESMARAFIVHECEVKSRNELDTNPDAAKRFHDLIRKPYLAWKEIRDAERGRRGADANTKSGAPTAAQGEGKWEA